MKITTWNVNSIKARLPNVLAWLEHNPTDILLLQELKTVEENFPVMEFEDLGYNLAIAGQKTYNGVAIASKYQLEDITTTLPGYDHPDEARYIEAVISLPERGDVTQPNVLRIASIYVPNGGEPGSDKFANKMQFFDALTNHARTLLTYDEPLVLGADYNVAPEAIDVYDPDGLYGTTCYHPDEHEKFRALMHLGLTDAFRALHPNKQQFSWWDYRGGGYQHNKGMRIDHVLLSPQAADILKDCVMDEQPRAEQKASDHIPVTVELAL